MEAIDIRKEVHEEIDRMTEEEVKGLKEFLATYPDPVEAEFRKIPYDDEPFTEEDRRLLAEAQEWLEQNGGEGIPDEEITREFGPI